MSIKFSKEIQGLTCKRKSENEIIKYKNVKFENMLSYVALDVVKQVSGRQRITSITNKTQHGCRGSSCP